MASKRRRGEFVEKDVGSCGGVAGLPEQGSKRRRVGGAGFGLGAFAGLVGKAFRVTASVFGGRQRSRQVQVQQVGSGGDNSATRDDRSLSSSSTAFPRPGDTNISAGCRDPPPAVQAASASGVVAGAGDGAGGRAGGGSGNEARCMAAEEAAASTMGGKGRQGLGHDPALAPHAHPHLTPYPTRRGDLGGLPDLDVDALRHSLSFLLSGDLARFSWASTSTREVVSTHCALIIAERYAGRLRLGAREQRPQASPRRLAFGGGSGGGGGTPPEGAGAAAAAAGGGPAGAAVPAPFAPSAATSAAAAAAAPAAVPGNGNVNNYSSHGGVQVWNQEAVVDPSSRAMESLAVAATAPAVGAGGRTGEGAGRQRGQRRNRGAGVGDGASEFVRYEGGNLGYALPALRHLECCGDLLVRQLKTLPRLDLFRTLQSRAVLGPSQYLTAHMRAVLVDWCVEVAFQFRLSTISLHAAVSALDVCLSKVAVPRCRLQLLGVVCAMIQSQAGGGCQVMSTAEAIHICDSQYNPSQVHSTFNIVVSNTQQATARTVPASAAEILHRHLSSMGERSGLACPLSVDWEKHSQVREENVLAGLLIDLSLLDQFMFRFRPGTLASAALFLARVTAVYYSKEEVWVTPYAVVEKTNREVLRLYGKGVCRPFVELNKDLELRPFGAPGLGEFVASQPREAAAVRKCVDRLWLVQQDFFKHVSGLQSPHPVLFRYQHMFKGIKDKFVPTGSKRLQAYVRLGLVRKSEVDRMLDKHLPTTRVVPPVSYQPSPGASAAAAVAAAAAAQSGSQVATAATVGV